MNPTCAVCQTSVFIPSNKQLADYKKTNLAFRGSNALTSAMLPVVTKCDHVFHDCCLKGWVEPFIGDFKGATCPVCRIELIPADKSIEEHVNSSLLWSKS